MSLRRYLQTQGLGHLDKFGGEGRAAAETAEERSLGLLKVLEGLEEA